MEKKIKNFIFKKYDDFWQANIFFNSQQTTFEVYSEELNEEIILQIDTELDTKVLCIDKNAKYLLGELSTFFWLHNRNKVFTFSGFVIDEITSKLFLDFRMCYHCYGNDNFSDFANWYIDIKDFRIVGCSRQQL